MAGRRAARRGSAASGTGTSARRRRIDPLGVLGELLLTAGVLVLLFLGWQLWFNDLVVGPQQQQAAQSLQQRFAEVEPVETPDDAPDGVPVTAVPSAGDSFATVMIPRFGEDYTRVVAEGIGFDVLNDSASGIGHYPGTQLPGEVGNFAVAAHRTTYGANFGQIGDLQLGDSIWVETAEGWYRYEYRNTTYVRPTGVQVLDPVPEVEGIAPTDRVITLTSCNPRYSAAERIVAYGVFDTFTPRADGPPAEIAALVQTEGT